MCGPTAPPLGAIHREPCLGDRYPTQKSEPHPEVLAGLTSVIPLLWEPRAECCQAVGLAEAEVEMDSVIGYAYDHRACA